MQGIQGTVEFRIYAYGDTVVDFEAVGIGDRTEEDLKLYGKLYDDAIEPPEPVLVHQGTTGGFDTDGSVQNLTTSISGGGAIDTLTVGDLTAGPGVNQTNGWFNDRFAPYGWDSATLDEAIANDDYLSFTVSMATGRSLDLTGLEARLISHANARNFALLSSASGFDSANVLTDFGGIVEDFEQYRDVDVSNVVGLQGITGTVEFRIYIYGSDIGIWGADGIGEKVGNDLTLKGNY